MDDDGELDQLRAAMDVCNRRLLSVLQERARLARVIGAWKRCHGLPAADPAREEAMLAAVLRAAPADGYPAGALQAIFAAVFTASRQVVEREE